MGDASYDTSVGLSAGVIGGLEATSPANKTDESDEE